MSAATQLAPMTVLEEAVAYARGVPGVMLPNPDGATGAHAEALLRYGAQIIEVMPCPSCEVLTRIDKLLPCATCLTALVCRKCQRYSGICKGCC